MCENLSYNILPNELSKHLEDLLFISSIKPGFKVNLFSRSFVDTESYTGTLLRTYHGESREKLIIFINNLVGATVDFLNKYKNTNWEKVIFDALSKAKAGIFNLSETYANDPGFISKINICLNKIDYILNPTGQKD